MIINKRELKRIEDMENGDCFISIGVYFMVTDIPTIPGKVRCVALDSGLTSLFDHSDICQICKIKAQEVFE